MDAASQGIGGGIGPSQKGSGHVTTSTITFPDKRPSARGQGSVKFAYFADPEGHVIGLCSGIVRE
jgi:hypothetical protein